MAAFYEEHPYPPPVDDLTSYRRAWDDARRRADAALLWPAQPYRADRRILIAGCGTTQAAHYALRWPDARVTGIDVSERSIAFSAGLKSKHALENLELRRLAIEDAAALEQQFDYIVCTGVLHHLPDPDAGLRALAGLLDAAGAMHLMLYAPYGRAGVYILQAYCRMLGIEPGDSAIDDLTAALRALPPDHPIVPLLRTSPDFAERAGIADALLHPQDRSYTVGELFAFLDRADLHFTRWMRQAPYVPACGAIASTPHRAKLAALPERDRFAALELFRGTMVRHSFVAYRDAAQAERARIGFEGEAWRGYVPLRLSNTVTVRERLPAGASAVLINRDHTFNDLYLPIDARAERLLEAIDGRRTLAQLAEEDAPTYVCDLFRRLWEWDQVVFDASR